MSFELNISLTCIVFEINLIRMFETKRTRLIVLRRGAARGHASTLLLRRFVDGGVGSSCNE